MFNGEIISADSIQVYKDFDIGTAKISSAEMKQIKHHMINILDDCSQFNVKKFLSLSYSISENLIKKGKLPVVCGGTALYLRSMITGIFPENENRRISRENLKKIADINGYDYLWKKLHRVDPDFAEKIGRNDKIRIIRGLEIYYNSGVIPSRIYTKSESPFSNYKFLRIGLNVDRDTLYKKINARVDLMIKSGLVNEVKVLRSKYSHDCPPFSSIGYREVIDFLEGKIKFDKCIELIKQHSRNFAKRQLTWFRNEKNINWFDPGHKTEIMNYLHEKLGK